MFGKKKALYDYQPKDLNHEQLNLLYAALVAKLTLACEELIGRHEGFASLASTLIETDVLGTLSDNAKIRNKKDAEEFTRSARRIRTVHKALVAELTYIKAHMVR